MKRWLFVIAVLAAFVLIPFALFGQTMESFTHQLITEVRGPKLSIILVILLIADVFLPIPSSLVSSYACQQLGPLVGFFLIVLGMTGSFATAYGLGYSLGTSGVEKSLGTDNYQKALSFGTRQSAKVALSLSRAIPVLAEGMGLFAGAARWPVVSSLLWVTLANSGVAAAYALFFVAFGQEAHPALLLVASVLIPALTMVLASILAVRAR